MPLIPATGPSLFHPLTQWSQAAVVDLSHFDQRLDELANRLQQAESMEPEHERDRAIRELEREIREVHGLIARAKAAWEEQGGPHLATG